MTAAELNLHVNTGLTGVNSAPKAFRRARCVRLFIIMGSARRARDVTAVSAVAARCPRAEVAFNDSEKSGAPATPHYLSSAACTFVCVAFVYTRSRAGN